MSSGALNAGDGAARTREFRFGDEDFNALRALVRKHTGISLSEAKRELVYGRLARRLRALGLQSFSDYRDLLADDAQGQELGEFCNAITANLTSFFRESHHFEYLREQVRPGDILFLGHSESMYKVSDDYTLINETIYRRNAT